MKKSLLVVLFTLLSVCQLFANPVDLDVAKKVGEKYVRTNISSLRNFQSSKHILTVSDDQGNACFYIFNVEDKGYFIVSADDRAKPVLAYSDEGALDINNLPPSMSYYLDHYKNAISYAINNDFESEKEIRNEWNLIETRGVVAETNLGKSVEPLVDLLWHQVYPYNYCCPTDLGGPEGRAFAGCAADAMAMIMKYWNYPETGEGQHSYIPEGYQIQTAKFGETTYDWDNMPNILLRTSPVKQLEAVGTLIYHCGVSIDMKYGSTASSAYSEMVPGAMKKYFRYTDKMRHLYRDDFSKTEWENLLIENFDQGFPVFYAGTSQMSGGHAFVCDGYTEDRYFHFNWGWSGVSNGYFAIDALNPPGGDYNVNQRAIFDMLPDYAYVSMPKAPVVETETNSAYSYKGMLRVSVPTESESGETLETIDKIVVLRDNVEVYSENNPTPGEVVIFEDQVDDYGLQNYSVYAISNGVKGRRTELSMPYGPTCSWNLISTTTSFQGWNGAVLKIMGGTSVLKEISATNSSNIDLDIQMPEGEVSFVWSAPKMPVSSITFKIRNSSNEVVYEYSGNSNGLQEGALYSGNNTCENCKAPQNLTGEFSAMNGKTGILISWDKVDSPESYKIYRSVDNKNYEEVAKVASSENQYFDNLDINGLYYYQVTAYNDFCESLPATTSDLNVDYVAVEYLSIPENEIDAMIYPNPTSGKLNIKAESMTNVSVYNIMGQKVIEQDVDSDEMVLDMKALEDGIYMLKVVSMKGEAIQRISVTK